MSNTESQDSTTDSRWYDLFSRGGRDLLRHNQKVRQAVREHIMDLAAGVDVLSVDSDRRVQVPVRFLEHHRFRLASPDEKQGVGQGEGVQEGDVLRQAQPEEGAGKGASGSGEGGLEFVLEFKVDELVDWLWEELELPNLEPRTTALDDEEFTREGLDRHGPRARLDRRRSLKEAIKRRVVQPDGPAFTNEDLRYRQLVRRPRPSTHAVVFFALDVSSSMTEPERRLAKTFFFWALQGLRRQYRHIETVFIAHTVQAWEFPEEEFFQATAQGGTVASTAFRLAQQAIDDRFDPGRYNIYLFYASDGENFADDREPAFASLKKLGRVASFMGYVETGRSIRSERQSETTQLFQRVGAEGHAVAVSPLAEEQHLWGAIRKFFGRAAAGTAEEETPA